MQNQDTIIPPFEGKFEAVVIFGPPGSGKGTLGRVLSSAGGHFHLSSGDVFRGLAPESPAGKVYHEYALKGLLVPDDVMMEIFRYYVAGLVATNQYFPEWQFLLLDGVPRTLAQAELFGKIVDVKAVISLEVGNEDVLIKRLQRRATIENRQDDLDEAVLRKRLEVYHRQTAEVLSHYPDSKIHRFDGSQRPLEVLRDVLIDMADLFSEHYHLRR